MEAMKGIATIVLTVIVLFAAVSCHIEGADENPIDSSEENMRLNVAAAELSVAAATGEPAANENNRIIR